MPIPGREKKSVKDKLEQKPGSGGKGPLRLIALSDSLFATVLTLLVLDLRIPEAFNSEGWNVAAFAKGLGPHLFSYLLTFSVAGTYWLAHHRDFDRIIHSNRRLLEYNLLFLLFIGLLPFSTAAVSLVGSKGGSYPFFWAIYAANVILAGIMLTLTWNYAVSRRLVHPETTKEQSRYITVRQMVIPAVFLASIAAEYLSPKAYLGPYTLLAIPAVLAAVDRFLAKGDRDMQAERPGRTELFWQAGTALPWILVFGAAVWAMTL